MTPRFREGAWENDRSEIRHFPKNYWTIGHVLESGLVIPDVNEKVVFDSPEEYLNFFKNVLVRNSGSKYEKAIAEHYSDFVRSADDPESIPLLIPEFRFEGKAKAHKYRLDFTVINPFTMEKVAYELSPWSTHGYLSKLKGLTQEKINEMASDNFEKEMEKHRNFFKKHRIFALIYTDKQLANVEGIFEDMKQFLNPATKISQLDLALLGTFFD